MISPNRTGSLNNLSRLLLFLCIITLPLCHRILRISDAPDKCYFGESHSFGFQHQLFWTEAQPFVQVQYFPWIRPTGNIGIGDTIPFHNWYSFPHKRWAWAWPHYRCLARVEPVHRDSMLSLPYSFFNLGRCFFIRYKLFSLFPCTMNNSTDLEYTVIFTFSSNTF